MSKDLRTYINQLMEHRPQDLRLVDRQVDPVLELTGYVEKLEKGNQFPAVFFKNVADSKLPIFINSLSTYDRLALSLGTTVQEMVPEVADRESKPIPCKEVSRKEAPVKEIVLTGDQADLGLLPILHHCEHDAGKYIAGGITLVKDRETGKQNAGWYRLQLQGPRQLGFMVNPINHANYVRIDYEEHNEPMPVAIVIGHHPAMYMGAVSKIYGIGGEMEAMGGFLQEPLEVVQGETIPMTVPARAEIVIEGWIHPGKRHYEGPFGEWPKYYSKDGDQPYIEVSAITMRKDAIMQELFNAHAEHLTIGALPRMGSLYRQIKGVVPHTTAVNLPYSGCGRIYCYISIKKRSDGEPKQAAFAALATEPNIKHVYIVDEDIDVFNENEVLWALATRFEADRQLITLPNCMGSHLVPTSYDHDRLKKGNMQTKLIFDCTKPAPPVKFPVKAEVPKGVWEKVDLADLSPLSGEAFKELMSRPRL